MTLASQRSRSDVFRRWAGALAIVAGALALLSSLVGLAAVDYDFAVFSDASSLIAIGAARARWIAWSFRLNLLGNYLLLLPLLISLHRQLRGARPDALGLASLCGVLYIALGAVGSALLAAAWPPLIAAYEYAVQHAAQSQVASAPAARTSSRLSPQARYGGLAAARAPHRSGGARRVAGCHRRTRPQVRSAAASRGAPHAAAPAAAGRCHGLCAAWPEGPRFVDVAATLSRIGEVFVRETDAGKAIIGEPERVVLSCEKPDIGTCEIEITRAQPRPTRPPIELPPIGAR